MFAHLIVAGVLFLGTLACSLLPVVLISFNSPEKLRICTVFGAGLLIGTALISILPEGVALLYIHDGDDGGAAEHHHHGRPERHQLVGLSLTFGWVCMLICDRLSHACGGSGHRHGAAEGGGGYHRQAVATFPSSDADDEDVEASVVEPSVAAASTTPVQRRRGSITPRGEDDYDVRAAEQSCSHAHANSKGYPRNGAAVLGLVVHSLADGVVVGAATFAGRSALQAVVLAATVLHKAPAAVGLGAFLLQSGEPFEAVLRRLILFAAASPAAALATCALLSLHAIALHDDALAMCLLVSAGSFLYASMVHILPTLKVHSLGALEMFTLVAGIISPLLMGSHAH